jgi:hypothetical protein
MSGRRNSLISQPKSQWYTPVYTLIRRTYKFLVNQTYFRPPFGIPLEIWETIDRKILLLRIKSVAQEPITTSEDEWSHTTVVLGTTRNCVFWSNSHHHVQAVRASAKR